MAVFPSISPNFGFEKTHRPNLLVTKMGDGYERRTTFGLPTHADPMTLSVPFENLSENDANTIEDFLAERVKDGESFDFIPPGESQALKFTYKGHKKKINYANLATIQITMQQVFD